MPVKLAELCAWLEKIDSGLVPKKVPIHLESGKVITGIRWVNPQGKEETMELPKYNHPSIRFKKSSIEGRFGVESPYNASLVTAYHSIPGAVWNSQNKTWWFPATSLPKVLEVVKKIFPEKKENLESLIRWSIGSGYQTTPFVEKQFVLDKAKNSWVKIMAREDTYVKEDGMSFGVGDERGYVYHYTAIPITSQEQEKINLVLAQREEITKKRKELKEKLKYIEKEGIHLNKVSNSEISGGRVWNLGKTSVGREMDELRIKPDTIWYLQYNGSDGDDWGRNNYPGYIITKISNSPEEQEKIEELLEVSLKDWPQMPKGD